MKQASKEGGKIKMINAQVIFKFFTLDFTKSIIRMNASIEISLYPLQEDYEPPILDFIYRLRQYPGIDIHTNALSTQLSGEYDLLMELLSKEIKTSFQQGTTQIMVLKILNIKIDVPTKK